MVLKKAVLYKVWDSWNANMKKIRKMRNTGAKVVLLWQRLGLSTGFYGWIERKPEANGRCGRKDCFEVEAHHTHQLSHVVVDGAPVRQKPEEEECRTGSASDAEDEAGVGVCQGERRCWASNAGPTDAGKLASGVGSDRAARLELAPPAVCAAVSPADCEAPLPGKRKRMLTYADVC